MEAAKVEGFSNDLPVILFISFFTILIMCMNRHDIFILVQRIDGKFMFANAFYFFS